MLYESAVPLARLYSPLLKNDDTFILQEYFIPKEKFRPFVIDLGEVMERREGEREREGKRERVRGGEW